MFLVSLETNLHLPLNIVHVRYSLFMELVPDPDTGHHNCQETWERTPQLGYGSFLNITQFIIPFTTIVICYAKIMIRLRQRARGKPGSRSAKQREEEAARNARVNKMLISMVIIFGISWFPINLINLIADTSELGESTND